MMEIDSTHPPPFSKVRAAEPAPPERSERNQRLFRAAQKLEAQFLSEMLGHAGLGKPRESFGGGIGEEQFSSFLRQAQAEALVARGGIGLAQHLFEALKVRADGAG